MTDEPWLDIGTEAAALLLPPARREPEQRRWGAIATGFNLPLASVREIVWVCFWRRSAARCGRVADLFGEDGYFCDGCTMMSRAPVPNFPWQVRPASGLSHLVLMMRAAARWQVDHTSAWMPSQGSWREALAACEAELDEELDAWVDNMAAEDATIVRGLLSTWAEAPQPEWLLDHLDCQRGEAADAAMMAPA